MAAVEIMISGVLYDKLSRTSRPVLLAGEASLAGLGVGGGPIIPDQPPSGGDGDHIWGGGNVPMPNPPIANVPGVPGYQPPVNVIVAPKPPEGPPQQPYNPVPPTAETKHWAWHPSYGWGYFPPNQAVPKG